MNKKPRIVYSYQPKRPIWPFIIMATSISLFVWIGYCSMEHKHHEDDALVDSVLEQMRNKQYTAEQRKREIMEVFNVTEAEISKPVSLFDDRGGL